jgi:hypothetical protein
MSASSGVRVEINEIGWCEELQSECRASKKVVPATPNLKSACSAASSTAPRAAMAHSRARCAEIAQGD